MKHTLHDRLLSNSTRSTHMYSLHSTAKASKNKVELVRIDQLGQEGYPQRKIMADSLYVSRLDNLQQSPGLLYTQSSG